MNSRSISTYSNLQFFLISNKECALAHSCACGGRLQHLHCTPQCASLAERFIYQENTFLIYKKRDTNKCISLKYCFIHSYVGIIQIRLWVEVLNFLSAWYTSSPCFLHMISIKSCLIDVNRFLSLLSISHFIFHPNKFIAFQNWIFHFYNFTIHQISENAFFLHPRSLFTFAEIKQCNKSFSLILSEDS